MNDEAKHTLQTKLNLHVWELLCLLASCTLLGQAISSYELAHGGHGGQPLPTALVALTVLLVPALTRYSQHRRLLAAKPESKPCESYGCMAQATNGLYCQLHNTEPDSEVKDMKPNQPKMLDETEAVSPVIGVILMVAITVVLAAVVFVLVGKLSQNSATEAPHLQIATNDNGKTYYIVLAAQSLPYADLTITGCTGIPAGPNVAAGDTWTTCTGILTVTHKPSNTVLYRSA